MASNSSHTSKHSASIERQPTESPISLGDGSSGKSVDSTAAPGGVVIGAGHRSHSSSAHHRHHRSSATTTRGGSSSSTSAATSSSIIRSSTGWFQRRVNLRPVHRGCHLVTDEVLKQIPEIGQFQVGICHLHSWVLCLPFQKLELSNSLFFYFQSCTPQLVWR